MKPRRREHNITEMVFVKMPDDLTQAMNDAKNCSNFEDFKRHVDYIEKNHDIKFVVKLGTYFYDHKYVPERMIHCYQLGAEHGNQYSMISLGEHYDFKDYQPELAIKYYLMCVEKGNVKAMNRLGDFYFHRQPDGNEALVQKYYKMAIATGDEQSMNSLGYYYHEKKQFELAEKYYLMTSKTSAAYSNLAYLYIHDVGTPEKMIEYHQKCFPHSKNDSAGKYEQISVRLNLIGESGLMLDYGKLALDTDERHIKIFQLLANHYGVNKQYDEMTEMYLKGINNGCVSCMNNLSYYYLALENDEENFLKYNKMAVDKGNKSAIENLKYYNEVYLLEKEKEEDEDE